jgi:hypothetical protein
MSKSNPTATPQADSKKDTFALKRETVRSMVVRSTIKTGMPCGGAGGSRPTCHGP